MALTDHERAMAEEISAVTLAKFLSAATNPDVAEKVIDTWGGRLKQLVGGAVLRMLLYLLIGVVFIGSFKLGITDKLYEWIKAP